MKSNKNFLFTYMTPIVWNFFLTQLVAILLILICLFPIFKKFYTLTKKEIFVQQEDIFMQKCSIISNECKYMVNFSQAARNDAHIQNLITQEKLDSTTQYYIIKAQSFLSNTYVKPTILNQYYIINKQNELYLSNNYSAVNTPFFYGKSLGFKDKNYNEFRGLLEIDMNMPVFLPSMEAYIHKEDKYVKVLPYLIPMYSSYSLYSHSYDSLLVCLLDLDKMDKLLFMSESMYDYYYIKSNLTNEILYQNIENEIQDDLNNLISCNMDELNITIYAKLNDSAYNNIMKHATETFIVCISFALIASILSSLLIAVYHASPILHIKKILRKMGTLGQRETTLKNVESDINDLDAQIEQHLDFVKCHNTKLKNIYFKQVIRNTLSPSDLENATASLSFLNQPYKVCLLYLPALDDSCEADANTIKLFLHSFFSNLLYVYEDINNRFVFVISANSEVHLATFEAQLLSILSHNVETSTSWICTVSTEGRGVSALYHLHQQADCSMRMKYNPDVPNIYVCQEPLMDARFPISLKTLSVLNQHLINGNHTSAIEIIERIEDTIYSAQPSAEKNISEAFFNVYNVISFTIYDQHYKVDLPIYNSASTIYDLFFDLKSCIFQICDSNKQNKSEKINITISKFYEYINNNFGDPELSASKIADYLGFSEKYLFTYIKTNAGRTISSYILDVRMYYATQYLATTSMKINEISETCGFYTVNSFYKNFKQVFQEPPAQWRKRHTIEDVYKLDFLNNVEVTVGIT